MQEENLAIHYKNLPNITFPLKTSMESYITSETDIWKGFLQKIKDDSVFDNLRLQHGSSTNSSILTMSFGSLQDAIDDPRKFNRISSTPSKSSTVPPPSSSLIGQLILGLFERDEVEHSKSVFLLFLKEELLFETSTNRKLEPIIERGEALMLAASASIALPSSEASAKEFSSITRSAKAEVEALTSELQRSREANDDRRLSLLELKQQWHEREANFSNSFHASETGRTSAFSTFLNEKREEFGQKISEIETQISAFEKLGVSTINDQNAEFERLQELFYTQLRLRAPVALWETRAEGHGSESAKAFKRFYWLILVTVAAGFLIPFCLGDYIANSFTQEICSDATPKSCTQVFSPKGPLTIAGLLTFMSLAFWSIRLQYRLFLSERHLKLDASEKQAFAETYMAMKEGEDVADDNEAIVLAALFRPTQDGIIKDDESSLDLSSAALLARQLGKP